MHAKIICSDGGGKSKQAAATTTTTTTTMNTTTTTTNTNTNTVDSSSLHSFNRVKEAITTGITKFHFPGIAISIAFGSSRQRLRSSSSSSDVVSISNDVDKNEEEEEDNKSNDDDTDLLIWSYAQGYSNIEKQELMDVTTDSFCIGSITKTLIALIVLQLVEEGLINLDFTILKYFEFDDDDDEYQAATTQRRNLIKKISNTSEATIRQLLCHQSGIPTWEFDSDWIQDARGRYCSSKFLPFSFIDTLEYLTRSNQPQAIHKPGEMYSYSNTNYTLLGLLIEQVTENEVSDEIQRRILNKLNLNSAFLDGYPPTSNDVVKTTGVATKLSNHYHYATETFIKNAGLSTDDCHIPVDTGCDFSNIVNTSNANFSCEWTAGGMIMTMPELMKYGCALLRSKGHLLNTPDMRKELFEYRPPKSDIVGISSSGGENTKLDETTGRYSQGICKTISKVKKLSTNKCDNNDDDDDDFEDVIYYGHGGLTLGFSSRLAYFPEYDIAVAVATNIGLMHSGFEENDPNGKSPWDKFFEDMLLPALITTFDKK